MESNLLVELDCILDTRLGTYVSKLDIPAELVFNKGLHYWSRLSEEPEFYTEGLVTLSQFQEAYKNRDVNTLKNSVVTNVVHHIKKVSQTLRREEFRGREIDKVSITVNYYPYDLSKEQVDIFTEAIKHIVSLDTDVYMISLKPSDAHPRVLSESYDAYMVYNFEQWLEPFALTLHNEKHIPLTVIAPALWFNKPIPTPDDIRNTNGEMIDPFKALITMFLATFELDLVPVGVFSIMHPMGYDKLLDKIAHTT